MIDLLYRTWEELMGRASGPLHLRLILQPLMACLLAPLAGLRDARAGRTPFFWALASDSGQRRSLLMQGWEDIGRLFFIAVILDVIYSLIVLHRVAPLQTLLVAVILALLPYLLIRGVATRLAAHLGTGRSRGPAESGERRHNAHSSSE